jgi:hypothetical protein
MRLTLRVELRTKGGQMTGDLLLLEMAAANPQSTLNSAIRHMRSPWLTALSRRRAATEYPAAFLVSMHSTMRTRKTLQ